MTSEEIKSLTGLRGIAALWVVYLHYGSHLKLDSEVSVFALIFNRLRYNGIVAVDIFFILSALVMCLAYSNKFSTVIKFNDYKVFMKKRFVRIYPAFLFWMFMFLCLFDFYAGNFPVFKIIVNTLLTQNFFNDVVIQGVFWSLSSEWILYFLFPFLFFVLNKMNTGIHFALIVLCILVYYVLPSFANYAFDLNDGLILLLASDFVAVTEGLNSVIRCLLSYILGISGFMLFERGIFKKGGIKSILYIGSAASFFIIFPFFGKNTFTYVILVSMSFILVLSLYSRGHKKSFFNSKLLYYFGTISYSIYVSHMFILILFGMVAKKLFGAAFLESYQPMLVVLSLVILIPISNLSYKIVEKKGGILLRKLLFKKDIAAPKKAW